MNSKPTIEDLKNPEKYDLLAVVEQGNIREFVIRQVVDDKKIIPVFVVYQTLLFLVGTFFLTRAIVLACKGNITYLLVTAGAILFSFTLLIIIHELLHGLALKLAGAPRVTFGGMLKKFIFFAEADHFVLGKRSFLFVAFTPLIFIQIITIAGIVIWFNGMFVYFFLMVMSVHSFFCSGDVALATIFFRFPGRETFTYDNREEKKSYYYITR